MKNRLPVLLVLMGALAIPAAQLKADSGKKHGGNPHEDHVVKAHDRHDDDDDRRWERRGDYEVRIYNVHEGRPPGWSHGRKTGWGNCGLPPGQAKKYGCQTYVYRGRAYYYYEDERGRVIVRRPHVHIGVDIH